MACGVLSVAPVLLVFLVGQRWVVPAFAAGQSAGLDTTGSERHAGQTQTGDIFLHPDRERTLIGGGVRRDRCRSRSSGATGKCYVNIAHLADPAALAPFRGRPWVIAQLPADPRERRPAHGLSASRSDIADLPAEMLWRQRQGLDGNMLRCVVITAGPGGAAIVDAQEVRHFSTTAQSVADSIGTGDFFAAGLIAALADHAVRRGQTEAARFLRDRPAMLRSLGPD